MSGRDRIPMTSGVGVTHSEELMKKIMCETCAEADNDEVNTCTKCVKFSNWKDVEG